MEVGVAYTAFDGDPSTAAGLLAAPAAAPRSSPVAPRYLVRLWTPVAKGVNRVRGNRRVAIAPADEPGSEPEPPAMSGPDGPGPSAE